MKIAVIILIILSVILIYGIYLAYRNKSESFTAGCKGSHFMSADYFTKQYPYYGDEYFSPLSKAQTNLEGVAPTTLYSSPY